jgi:hypothetical protein
MSPLIRQFLSPAVIRSLVKKGFNFDLTLKDLKLKDIDLRFKDLKLDRFRKMFGSSTTGSPLIPPVPEIPPVPSTPRIMSDDPPASSPASKRRSAELTDTQIEDAIGLLFEYFEETFAILKGTLSDAGPCRRPHNRASCSSSVTAFAEVMKKIWKEILTVMEGLLVPPLSDAPAEMKPLSDKEVYIAMRWLKVRDR